MRAPPRRGASRTATMILKVDGTKVADRTELVRALGAGGPKKVVTVLRDGKEVELNLSWETPAAEKSKQ